MFLTSVKIFFILLLGYLWAQALFMLVPKMLVAGATQSFLGFALLALCVILPVFVIGTLIKGWIKQRKHGNEEAVSGHGADCPCPHHRRV